MREISKFGYIVFVKLKEPLNLNLNQPFVEIENYRQLVKIISETYFFAVVEWVDEKDAKRRMAVTKSEIFDRFTYHDSQS